MSNIVRDLPEVYMHPEPGGMAFSRKNDSQTVPVWLRVEIDAYSRSNWFISDVWMLEEEGAYNQKGVWRKDEVAERLQGSFKDHAVKFITSQFQDFLQERVDCEIVPEAVA